MFHCLGDYGDNEPLLFWWVFSLAGFCHKSEKVSRKIANIEAENSLRDPSYCWRVLSDQVGLRVNNIGFANVGNTGIVFLAEVESRTQGSRPRTQKNPRPRTAFPRTDTLEAKDRNARGQGPRTQAQVLSKKKVFTKTFQAISTKKRFPKNFSSAPQNFNNSKNTDVLESRTGQFSRT